MELTAPENVGFSSDRLQRLNRFLQGYIDDGKLAGIVTLLARKGAVFHHESFGKMSNETGVDMNTDSIFRIYSMSKAITSVALMKLHEEGGFQIDDPVSAFIPELGDLMVCTGSGQAGPIIERQKNPITIRQLLSHTSGLSYGFHKDTPVDQMYRDASINSKDTDLATMMKKLGDLPLAYQPGTDWRYSVATDVCGSLVEVLSGQSFDKYLSENVFEPLDMKDTAFYVPGEKLDRFPAVYGPSESGTGPIEELDRPYDQPPVRLSGGGGLVGTTADYSNFCQMMVNGGNLNDARILGPKTVDLMTRSHLPDEVKTFTLSEGRSDYTKGCGFGLGFRIIENVAKNGIAGSAGSYSWGGAASTYFLIDPVEDMYAIFMTQFLPSGQYPIRAEFQTMVYQALVE
jgi:CubicO group peptidase (beta-lactamase class C family)